MNDETRSLLAQANTALIRYPRFKALHNDIRECQEMSRLANEPQCMSLEGVTGAGKSTLVQDYVALFPRVEQSDGTRIPIFYAETPSPVTVKGMAATLLAHLGDPAAHHGTLWAMNFRLIHLMMACQLELVILDDFHHLIDKETNRILEQVSDWLKVLIKETGIPFLVVGIEGTPAPAGAAPSPALCDRRRGGEPYELAEVRRLAHQAEPPGSHDLAHPGDRFRQAACQTRQEAR